MSDLVPVLTNLPKRKDWWKYKSDSKQANGLCAYKGCFNPRHVSKNGKQAKCCKQCQSKQNKRAWERKSANAILENTKPRISKKNGLWNCTSNYGSMAITCCSSTIAGAYRLWRWGLDGWRNE